MSSRYIDINKILVDRCRKGDSKAQYELYHLYARQMYNVTLRIVNHITDAEDILQDSFLEAFNNINEYREEASFGAWLKKIVVNRSINALKKRKLLLFDQIPGADDLTDHGEGIDMEDLQLEVKRVNNCMMQLPVGYRLVLSLYLLEGYDHSEIGQILNITESTSKSQYNRGKEKLRELLKVK